MHDKITRVILFPGELSTLRGAWFEEWDTHHLLTPHLFGLWNGMG
jgi:hypothetical protein